MSEEVKLEFLDSSIELGQQQHKQGLLSPVHQSSSSKNNKGSSDNSKDSSGDILGKMNLPVNLNVASPVVRYVSNQTVLWKWQFDHSCILRAHLDY